MVEESSGAEPEQAKARSKNAGAEAKGAEHKAAEMHPPANHQPLTIVGVGGSAGGIEAFRQLLENLPAKFEQPMAIVFILHLLPTHKSLLSELLGRATAIPVVQAKDDMPLEPSHVYVIPPDAYMELRGGRLRLMSRGSESSLFLPIDRFFVSLAQEAKERAIGVVLSGSGADGAIGLRQIKEAGGVAFVQSPESAEHEEMPRAAMAAGEADFVLPPSEIAKALVEFSRNLSAAETDERRKDAKLQPSEKQFERIFSLLRTASGVDFSHYKRPTIERRLQRRMALQKITSVADYIELLQRQPQETNLLYRDILIHVTFFFREAGSFAALTEKVFPRLLEQRRSDESLRIWIPGCSTGEEAYSLAISLLEFLGEKADDVPIQIFATDISDAAIDAARAGMYSEAAVGPVSPERLRRYFAHVDGKYRVNKRVREACIFARHDVTRDPPFSRIDLIMCRNVLIYMDVFLQKRLLSAFHYALKPNGYLMLGAAETVGAQSDLFFSEDKKHRLYSKRAARMAPLDMGPLEEREPGERAAIPLVKPLREPVVHKTIQQEANQLVMSKYAPPGVLVNEKLDIVQFRGQTGFFLEPAPGDVSLNVLSMIRPGLLHALQQALADARKAQAPVRREGLHVAFNSHGRDVNLEVIPILAPDEPMHFLILFEDITEEAAAKLRKAGAPPAEPALETKPGGEIDQLQRELETTRRYLQQTIQDLEVVNEELQSSNEEVLSTNEELQSTNEELDTAKEELQSTNEELNTLNAELHSRNEELSRLNSDLLNLLRSVQLAVIMVDRTLAIRRFTPAAEKLFNLIPTDIGRPLQHLKPNIECPQLHEWIRGVIETAKPLEREIQDMSGKWYALRIWPYSSLDDRIEGAVIALVDIDAAKQRELSNSEAREALQEVLESVGRGLAVLDERLAVQTTNAMFCRLCSVAPQDAAGKRLFDIAGGHWNIPRLRTSLEELVVKGGHFEGLEIEGPARDGKQKKYAIDARLVQSDSRPKRLLLTIKEHPAA